MSAFEKRTEQAFVDVGDICILLYLEVRMTVNEFSKIKVL
jgi:hypothetical protein